LAKPEPATPAAEAGNPPSPRRVRRSRRWLWLGLVGVLVVSAVYAGYRWAVMPRLNPHPVKKVVVRGVFPFDRGWDLQPRMSFYTRNANCKKTARIFFIYPVADVAREEWVDIPLVRKGGNRYIFTYYEDHFLPGQCDWELRFVYTHLFQDGQWAHGSDAIMGLNRQFNEINYECHYMNVLTPGRGKDAREIHIVCGGDKDKPHRLNPQLTGNEVNFIWKSKILYDYYATDGRIESTWKEGEIK